MTDRQTSNPGQYKAVITSAELAKMQLGEEFVLHLTRDDHPLTEGTPYNKESVLPDELARVLCPDIPDPTPADALAALLPLDGGIMRGDVDMSGNKITGLADAIADTDAANARSVYRIAFPSLGYYGESNIDNGGRGMYLSRSSYPITINGKAFYNGHILSFESYGNSSCVQIAFDGSRSRIAFRTRWYSHVWSQWSMIQGTAAVAE